MYMENVIKARKKAHNGFSQEDWPIHYLEGVFCPLCNSKSFKKMYPKTYKRLVICSSCGLIFTSPRLKKGYLKHLYSKEYFNNKISSHFGYQDYLGDEKKIVKTFSKRILDIERVVKNKGKLLDIGCATGFFMKAAKDKKWDVEGVEISQFAASYASSHFKFAVYQQDFLELNLPENNYDVVTLWDVIEHFYDPVKALIKIKRILVSGGILVISTPDVNSIPAKLTKDKWIGYKLSDEHLTYFSIKTMKKLLEQTGFSIVKKNHVGKHVSLQMLSDRASIYNSSLGKIIGTASRFISKDYFLYINPLDIMCIYAKKE